MTNDEIINHYMGFTHKKIVQTGGISLPILLYFNKPPLLENDDYFDPEKQERGLDYKLEFNYQLWGELYQVIKKILKETNKTLTVCTLRGGEYVVKIKGNDRKIVIGRSYSPLKAHYQAVINYIKRYHHVQKNESRDTQ